MNDYRNLTTLASTVSVDPNIRSFGQWQIMMVPGDHDGQERDIRTHQVHGGNILDAAVSQIEEVDADGIVIRESGVRGSISTADCAAVTIMTDEMALILHISRKTLIHGLPDNVLTYIDPGLVNHVHVGPHICEYHFNFEEEGTDLKRFRWRYPKACHFHKGMMYVSLRKAIEQMLDDLAIISERVTYDGRCTFETAGLASYRRWLKEGKPGEHTGRIKTIVWK